MKNMRSLTRKPDDRFDRYTAQRLMCISYCEDEHYASHYKLKNNIDCWERTLQEVLYTDDNDELPW